MAKQSFGAAYNPSKNDGSVVIAPIPGYLTFELELIFRILGQFVSYALVAVDACLSGICFCGHRVFFRRSRILYLGVHAIICVATTAGAGIRSFHPGPLTLRHRQPVGLEFLGRIDFSGEMPPHVMSRLERSEE